uniref:Uncharacterized protein n=1 Tax=Trieres chinensis TaxID=1514140 RepID=A0A7S1ZPA8_TRICV
MSARASNSSGSSTETDELAKEALFLFKTATAGTLPKSVATSRLRESYAKYNQLRAMLASKREMDALVSVYKNLGSVAFSLGKREMSFGSKQDPKVSLYWLWQAIVNFGEAYEGCKKEDLQCKDYLWATNCLRKTELVYWAIFQFLVDSSDDWRVRDGQIQKLTRACLSERRLCLSQQYVLACLHLKRGRLLLNAATTAYNKSVETRRSRATGEDKESVKFPLCREANSCLSEMESSAVMVEQSLKRIDEIELKETIKSEFEEQKAEMQSLRLKVESTRLCNQALKLQETAVQGSDELNLDLIWDAADLFLMSMKISRGEGSHRENDTATKDALKSNGEEKRRKNSTAQNMECEAIAAARLGVLYESVLKNDFLAEPFLMHAIQLAHVIGDIEHRNMGLNDWFICATKSLQAVRAAHDTPDCEYTPREEFKAFAESIDAEIKESESKTTQARKLLNYLSSQHPAKNAAHRDEMKQKIETLDASKFITYKKALMVAAKCYHTDKNGAYGRDWVWLCGKIMRHVNDLFTFFKGVA